MLYRLAESQFLRMLAMFGGGGSTITQIEYRVDPKLEQAFAKKQREYDKTCEDKPNQFACRHTHLEEISFRSLWSVALYVQTGKASTSAGSCFTGRSPHPTSTA